MYFFRAPSPGIESSFCKAAMARVGLSHLRRNPSEDLDSARNRLQRLSQSAARLSPVPTEPTPPLYRQGPYWSTRGNLLFLIRESRLQLIGNGLCDLTLNREHVDKIAVISLRPYLSICARID
jgi:hypothetical protein